MPYRRTNLRKLFDGVTNLLIKNAPVCDHHDGIKSIFTLILNANELVS